MPKPRPETGSGAELDRTRASTSHPDGFPGTAQPRPKHRSAAPKRPFGRGAGYGRNRPACLGVSSTVNLG